MANTATALKLTERGKPYKKDMARAVRIHCFECMGGSWSEIERCLSPRCSWGRTGWKRRC
ncbi:MAG: hypothetical protein KJ621_20350 [Proteobacteria bacterium]|nr:hypothetical protein [Pseudomonadota bacterium]MBU1741626.1 hypothetical protein [Pseudomonadota bacterium]